MAKDAPPGAAPARGPPPSTYECRPGAAWRPLRGTYRRRQPDRTLLHALVAGELEGLLGDLAAASPYGRGLPRHVERELRAFLDCGRLENGFARVVCPSCRAEHLVAFSCKGRGVCPSCTTRRMHGGSTLWNARSVAAGCVSLQ